MQWLLGEADAPECSRGNGTKDPSRAVRRGVPMGCRFGLGWCVMHVQIVYGTRRGGTAGLAHMIATAFEREGWHVTIADVANSPGITDCDVLVVGGPLYLNRWPSDLREWVRHHMATLRVVPTWLFSSGPLDDSARVGDTAPVPSVAKLGREIEIAGHMTFGGYLPDNPEGLVAKVMARSYAGDWRDPAQVAEWVHRIVHHYDVRPGIPRQRTGQPQPEPQPMPPEPARSRAL